MEIGHLIHAGEHPDIAILAHNAGASFVNVQQGPTTQSFQKIIIGAGLLLRYRCLKLIRRIARDMKIKQLSHARGNATLGQPELDILIHRVICKIVAVFAGGPTWIALVEGISARSATLVNAKVTCDPSLYAMLHKLEV
jgi:hypothetical protein